MTNDTVIPWDVIWKEKFRKLFFFLASWKRSSGMSQCLRALSVQDNTYTQSEDLGIRCIPFEGTRSEKLIKHLIVNVSSTSSLYLPRFCFEHQYYELQFDTVQHEEYSFVKHSAISLKGFPTNWTIIPKLTEHFMHFSCFFILILVIEGLCRYYRQFKVSIFYARF